MSRCSNSTAELRADAVLQRKLRSLPNVRSSSTRRPPRSPATATRSPASPTRTARRRQQIELEGIFVQIGLLPNTDWLKGTVELSPRGEIVIDAKGARGQTVPSCHGVFAAGDCTTVPYKQIIIAALPETPRAPRGRAQRLRPPDPRALLCGLVQALASEQGRDLSAQEIQNAAQIIWEGVHGTVALRLSTDKDPWFQRLALDAHLDILLDVLLAGVATRWASLPAGAQNSGKNASNRPPAKRK
jgi:hypothetical protein